MKFRILIITLSLAICFNMAAQDREQVRIDWDYSGLTFGEFVSRVENQYPVRFFYRDEWISGLKLGDYTGNIVLTQLLDDLFKSLSLYYFIDGSGNIVITKNYEVRFSVKQVESEGNFIPPTEYYDAEESKKQSGIIAIEVGNPAERNLPGDVLVTGYITDRDTREPVSGATVFIQKLSAGTISNDYGFYSLRVRRGVHLVQISFIGMKEKLISLNLNGPGEMNVEMNSVLIPLRETVVSAQKSMVLQRYEVGVERVNITSFKLLPTSMGESDIIKSFLLTTGVQSVGEGSAGFNVRGGSADQNLILLYGAPIYNSSHFFGFFSAVNSDIIRDVTLYKGGIPGRYGGRISSVLDIVAKDGDRKEFHGNAGISPITTHLMVEGPLIKDTLTYILTGRTTYSNWIFQLIDNPALKRSRASFYDLNGKITYDIDKNNRIDLSSYYSHDSFRFNTDTVYGYDNNIVSLRWRHFFNSRFFYNLSLNNSYYKYNVTSDRNVTEAFVLSHRINSSGLKADFNWYAGRHEFNYGLDATRYSVMPGSYLPSGDSSLVNPKIIREEKAWESALYADDKFAITDYISVNLGLRLSGYFTFGPGEVLRYNPEFTRCRSSVTDTIVFKSHELLKSYAGPEIRASVNFRMTDNSSFKMNYNRTRQYLHLLSNSTSISPTDTWKLCDYYLKPQIGDQYALGYYRMLRKNTIEASAEVYYKEVKNMLDYKGGSRLIMDENVEMNIINALGKAYGAEFMIKKSEGKLRWSIGYTYARTFLKSTGKFSDEIINGGEWFPANFDKPHDLVVTFNYLFSRRFSFSSNYTYSTGRPITFPISTYHIGDLLLIHFSDRNKYRIPDYSRLDLSLRFSGNLKARKIAHPYWTFSVYNMLARNNIYSIYFMNENDLIKGYKLSIFGRAIPSLTFSFDF